MQKKFYLISLLSFVFISQTPAFANESRKPVTTVTFQTKESIEDKRFNYDVQLLELALNKTVASHGPFVLKPISVQANYARLEKMSEADEFENLIFKQSASDVLMKKLAFVPFPVDLGIASYRVALVAKNQKTMIDEISSFDELKKLSVIQGIGWLDSRILKEAGFEVKTSGSYDSLFSIVANNRADLFFRGVHEVKDEWLIRQKELPIDINESFALYYPLPRFFFTNQNNAAVLARLEQGLKIAYHDGSLLQLWKKHYLASIEFSHLSTRKLYFLDNPFIKEIDPSCLKYMIKPEELTLLNTPNEKGLAE